MEPQTSRTDWLKVTAQEREDYYHESKNLLDQLQLPTDVGHCQNFNCPDEKHLEETENLYADLTFASFGQDSRLSDSRVLGKFPRSQHRPSLITPPRLKVPAHIDPVNHWSFRKADWKCFCLLTGEFVERLPPPDTPNIERAYQDFCKSLLSAAKQCISRGRRNKYVPGWEKSPRPSITPSSEHHWGLTLTEPLRPYSLGQNRRCTSGGMKLLIPSTYCTLVARRGEDQQTYWQVRMLLPRVLRLHKFHRLATCEERGTQDWRLQVHQTPQQAAVRPMEDCNT